LFVEDHLKLQSKLIHWYQYLLRIQMWIYCRCFRNRSSML